MNYVHRLELLSSERLAVLRRRSDARAWLQLASHFGAVTATGALLHALWGTPWAAPVWLIHGILLNYLYAAQHELMHGTAFVSRWLNEFFSRITGILMIFPRDYDRIMHFTHHKFTNIPDKDPELMGATKSEAPGTPLRFLWSLSAIPYWWRRLSTLARNFCGDVRFEHYMSRREKALVIREARQHVCVYALGAVVSVLLDSWIAVHYWLLPLLLTKPLHHIQNIVEHTGMPLVDDVTANTRTIRVNPLLRWLCWNMQYHCAHHLFAAVPFYNLPLLDRELSAVERNVSSGYIAAALDVIRRSRAPHISGRSVTTE
jgi:fatty acid desaturase